MKKEFVIHGALLPLERNTPNLTGIIYDLPGAGTNNVGSGLIGVGVIAGAIIGILLAR